jgi:CRP-like cAMP-binding protein
MAVTRTKNALLSSLSKADFRLLSPDLREVNLSSRQPIEEPGKAIEIVYFPETGLVSTVAHGRSRSQTIEVGLIGREGMTGHSLLMGIDRPSLQSFVQIAGNALTLPADRLRKAMAESDSLRARMQRYLATFFAQMASTIFANGHDKLEERLARWLLMARDRVQTDTVALTQEFLSIMLGARRPGVTVAIQMLEHRGLIRAERGHVTVIDRKGLEAFAGDGYGDAESEFTRLMR